MKHIGRKLYHLLGGVSLLALYFVLGRDRALVVYAALAAIVLTLDIVRLKLPAVNRFFFSRFSSFIRPSEEHRLTGTAPYIIGIGLSLTLYSPQVAATAICFLAFGDVAATAIGERYGRTKIRGKSLEGSAAFIVACCIAWFILFFLGIRLSPYVVSCGMLVAAGVELLPLPLNDNLVIPLVSGGIMELLSRWLSP